MTRLFTALLLLTMIVVCQANTIHVASDYSTIGQAIQAAVDNDTILVEPGTYPESQSMAFMGKDIVLISEQGPEVTTIQGGFIFIPADTVGAILDGFTITSEEGQMIVCFFNANPEIRNCIFRDGVSSDIGGAVMAASCQAHFRNCTFTNNMASDQGSAIFAVQGEEAPPCNIVLDSCRFIKNRATAYPQYGGIDIQANQGAIVTANHCFFLGDTTSNAACVKEQDSYITLNNCTISGYEYINFEIENDTAGYFLEINNSIINHGTGLAFLLSLPEDSLVLNQSVIYGYGPIVPESTITVPYHLNVNPLFCDTAAGNYHISDTSPCASANNEWGVLIGAYDPACHIPYLCGDADGSFNVSIADVVFVVAYMFGDETEGPSPYAAADPDCSGRVNMSDCVYLIAYIFGSGPEPCADCPL